MTKVSLLAVCAALCAFSPLPHASAQDMASAPPPPLRHGTRAPAFDTRSINGNVPLSLRRLRGHVVLVDYWATWCGPCRMATPLLERLHRQYAPQGLVVVGMNVDQGRTVAQVRPFIHYFGITYPVALLTRNNIRTAIAYHANSLPSQYLIDKKGVVRWSQAGFAPDEGYSLSLLIQKLLAERG